VDREHNKIYYARGVSRKIMIARCRESAPARVHANAPFIGTLATEIIRARRDARLTASVNYRCGAGNLIDRDKRSNCRGGGGGGGGARPAAIFHRRARRSGINLRGYVRGGSARKLAGDGEAERCRALPSARFSLLNRGKEPMAKLRDSSGIGHTFRRAGAINEPAD
jgi:hypothetical protein